MKSKEKSKKQPESLHQFTFPLSENSFFEAVEFAEKEKKNLVSIQLLKYGAFRHPWWGVLRFDDKFFDNLIKNFEADVPQEEIAFDFKHNPDWGAAAWVKSLYKTKEGFFADVEFTKKGRDSIKNKEFKYFSSEYSDDYMMYDFEEDEEGNEVEKKISYGPVLYGGGLTNRPFIKGMKPVSLSEDGTQVEMEEITEEILRNDLNLQEEVKRSMKTIEELQEEKKILEEKVKELEEKKDDDKSKEKYDELVVKLADIDKAVKVLSDKAVDSKGKKDKKKLEEEAEKKKLLEDELENQKKELKERDEKIKTLSDNLDSLSESVKKLTESNKTLHDDKVKAVTEKKFDGLKNLGVFPSTLKVIEPILFSEAAKNFSVTLSEKVDDKDVEVSKSLAEIIYDIMDSVPKDYRFSEDERSRSEIDSTGNKELSVEDIQKYANENKLGYAEALIELEKQGKV